jgi:hypothetical protein
MRVFSGYDSRWWSNPLSAGEQGEAGSQEEGRITSLLIYTLLSILTDRYIYQKPYTLV